MSNPAAALEVHDAEPMRRCPTSYRDGIANEALRIVGIFHTAIFLGAQSMVRGHPPLALFLAAACVPGNLQHLEI